MKVWIVLGGRDELNDREPTDCLVAHVGSSLQAVGDFFSDEGYRSWMLMGGPLDELDYAVTTYDGEVQYHTVLVREVDTANVRHLAEGWNEGRSVEVQEV